MKFTLPDGVFHAVKLSKKRQDALVEEAETVVSETIAANEVFLAQGAQFKDSKWRQVRAKEGLQVYRQRPLSNEEIPEIPTKHRSRTGSRKKLGTTAEEKKPQSPSSVVTETSTQERKRRPSVSLMVLHGTVDGTLGDSMFGAFAATDHAWKWRSSHINDRMDDARILTTIRTPTHEDPFRFLGIKWFAKEHPTVLTGILHRRDFLIMEATGIANDSKGEKVGYFLMHSVALRAVPELSEMGILRGELSFCFILRQREQGRVELYCRGFSDPRGDMVERLSVAIAAEALVCSAGVVDYAYIKKLTWLMKHKSLAQLRQSKRDTKPSHCESCKKNFSKFTLIAAAAGSATAGKGSGCQICHRVVCTKCSVVKKMTVDVSNAGTVKQCALRFCLTCLHEAKERSAWEMALDGLEASLGSPSTSRTISSAGTPPSRFTSLPHTLNQRREDRTYSEYQRAGTRVYRQGEMATDFRHSNKPDRRSPANQPSSKEESTLTRQFQTSPGERSAETGADERHMNRVVSPPARSRTVPRTRYSERPKSANAIRLHRLT